MYKGYVQFTRKHDVHRVLLLGGLLLFCLFLARTLSAAPLVLSAGDEVRVANASLSWLRDPAHTLQPSPELLSAPGWIENASGRVPSFGFTQDRVWLRLHVEVPPEGLSDWYLMIPYPLLEQVTLYRRAGDQLLTIPAEHAGGGAPRSSPHPAFYLRTLQGTEELLLSASSSTALQVPVELWSQEYKRVRESRDILWWGLYFGVILALMAYNLFLFFSVRDHAYLHYVLYLLSIGGLMLVLSGLGAAHAWTARPELNRVLLPLFTALVSVFALMFARAFLQWGGFPPRLDRLMKVAAVCAAALLPLAGIEPAYGAQLSGLVGAFVIGLVILAGFKALVSGVVIARYFVLAWMTFAVGAMLYLLNVFGLIPVSGLSTHAIQVGSAMEAVLLSLALAHRIKEERQQKLDALEQQRKAEQQMQQLERQSLDMALHDALTGMPNEAGLITRMQELMISPNSAYRTFALVLIKFPHLREIGGSLGRGLAESLFKQILAELNAGLRSHTQIISMEMRSQTYLAVTEFDTLAFLAAAGDDYDPVPAYARSVLARFERAVEVGQVALRLAPHAGVAYYPRHGERPDELLQHASVALENSTRNGDIVAQYSVDMEAASQRRLVLTGALQRAIHDAELELYLQPQIACRGLRLTGAEVLLRWNSPRHGAVPTLEFIGMAEHAGLMSELTRYVISQTFRIQARLWRAGMNLSLSINLSAQNLMDLDLVRFIVETAEIENVPLTGVVFEVTETLMIENFAIVVDNLNRLASTGCSIALDDFGTGYSSLAYLSRLPIHELKIDNSFVRQMLASNSDYRIVENTVKLARALGIQTVAEGVEDAQTLGVLTQLGCDRVQGYHLGRPMPLKSFEEWALRKAG